MRAAREVGLRPPGDPAGPAGANRLMARLAGCPYTLTYLPDFARGLVTLGTQARAWGEVWYIADEDPASAPGKGNPIRLARPQKQAASFH